MLSFASGILPPARLCDAIPVRLGVQCQPVDHPRRYYEHMFHEIPKTLPDTPLLDQVNNPEQLRALDESRLPQLARELREFLLYSVGQTGGHFGAGLGVVELTIALHYMFKTPEDRLVWDVGHQAYPHKILTGRRDRMSTLRQKDGLAAFPKREESEFDTFGVGHSSTSISAALGMAIAARAKGEKKTHCGSDWRWCHDGGYGL